MKVSYLILVMFLISFCACTTVQKGAAGGAVVGGGLGAIIGHQSGETGKGAAIGAAAGAVGGALIAEHAEKKFCPKCGRRFTASVENCPYDGTELKSIDDK